MSENTSPGNLDKPTVLSASPAGVGVVDVANPQKPLGVLVGPLNLKPLDHIDLYWAEAAEPVATYDHPLDAPPTNGFVTLSVERRSLESAQDPVPVRYRFTPFPGGDSQGSDIAYVRVKLEAPGGVDIDPATPYENEALKPPQVQPPEVIVDPRGVSVIVAPYEYMSEGDRISLAWGDRRLSHPDLTAAELDKEVVIPIPREIIEAVGNSAGLPVRYEIHDVVNNGSKWSPITEVVVSLDPR